MIHPSKAMMYVWCCATLLVLILPFDFKFRPLTLYGVTIQFFFVLLFVLGTLLGSKLGGKASIKSEVTLDTVQACKVLSVAAILSVVFFLIDLSGMSLDLSSSYERRSEAASNLLIAGDSNSSIWFKFGFILYPAAYVYVSISIFYENKINYIKIIIFGFLPVILASMVMGGRLPLLFLSIIALLAWYQRKHLIKSDRKARIVFGYRKLAIYTGLALVATMLFYYFMAVFLARAETVGGAGAMLIIAEDVWGVSFDSNFARAFENIFGLNVLYLVFVFSWYLLQGVVMANVVLTDYVGPLMYGAYGIDIFSAVVRRVDPAALANGFSSLLDLGIYGFFPSAWGSMYVDFGWLTIVLSLLWGFFAGFCYRRIVLQRSQRWFFIAPFIIFGILSSLINTPLGVSNGFVVYCWIFFIFCILKESQYKI